MRYTTFNEYITFSPKKHESKTYFSYRRKIRYGAQADLTAIIGGRGILALML